MLDAFFKRLKHPDPAVRRQAADELGKLEDESALGPLKEAYQAETDPAVREAIRAAGTRIQQAAKMRTQRRRSLSEYEENELAARIVSEATASSYQPSVGKTLKQMGLGGPIGALAGQATELQSAYHTDEVMRQQREMSRQLMNVQASGGGTHVEMPTDTEWQRMVTAAVREARAR